MAREGMSHLRNPGRRKLMVPYSLYRGVVPPLLGVTPMFAISFWVSQTKTP